MPFVRPSDENGPDLAELTFRQKWTPTARGWALIILALSSGARGWSYLTLAESPDQLAFIERVIPDVGQQPWWLAGLWLGMAAWCTASLLARRWIAALGACASVHCLWATSLIVSSVFLGAERAWVSSITYITVAGLSVIIAAMKDSNAT